MKMEKQSIVLYIPLPKFIIDNIKEIINSPDCYVLTGKPTPTEPHQFYLKYKTFMKKLGLENFTFHALRHTFATQCVEKGVDTKSLSEILGHSNIVTTMSLYVHPSLEQKRKQLELLSPTVCF